MKKVHSNMIVIRFYILKYFAPKNNVKYSCLQLYYYTVNTLNWGKWISTQALYKNQSPVKRGRGFRANAACGGCNGNSFNYRLLMGSYRLLL